MTAPLIHVVHAQAGRYDIGVNDPQQALEAVQGMMAICLQVADEAKALPSEKLRISVILVYLSDDASARAVAEAVVRASGRDAPALPSEPAAFAILSHHGLVIQELRAAGYEVSDGEDPGAGRIPAIFVVQRECVRHTLEIDPAAAARHDALMEDLNNLPAEVYAACQDALDRAATLSDGHRRQVGAIVVCECNDARSCEAIAAFARAAGQTVLPEPGKAASFLYDHVEVTKIAQGLGYEVAQVPDPGLGRMRVFFFVGGRCIATEMEVVHPEQVALDQQMDEDLNVAEAKRIFEEKYGLIVRAVRALSRATPGLLKTSIVVVFASRSPFALSVYREMVALPELRGFPGDLPAQGARVVTMGYDDFMTIVRRYDGSFRGYDGSQLGPDEVRIAMLTGGGVYFQRTLITPLSRGGSA